jgi:hypothetical protein
LASLLRLKRKFADFVQKNGSPIGGLEVSSASLQRPVKAPFSWPKSSEAINEAGMAAQLTRMNARPDRLE